MKGSQEPVTSVLVYLRRFLSPGPREREACPWGPACWALRAAPRCVPRPAACRALLRAVPRCVPWGWSVSFSGSLSSF